MRRDQEIKDMKRSLTHHAARVVRGSVLIKHLPVPARNKFVIVKNWGSSVSLEWTVREREGGQISSESEQNPGLRSRLFKHSG